MFLLNKIIFLSVFLINHTTRVNCKFDANNATQVKIIVSEMRRLFHVRPEIENMLDPLIIKRFRSRFDTKKNKIYVEAFSGKGESMNLTLTPLKHNVYSTSTPLTITWTVETSMGREPNYTYHLVDLGAEFEHPKYEIYHDEKEMAVLMLEQRGRYMYYDGIHGEYSSRGIIRPLPETWQEIYGREEEKHVLIFKRDINPSNTDDHENNKNDEEETTENLLYVKLLVVFDYHAFMMMGRDIAESIKFISIFWNAVNLKFSQLETPKIEITISGIIIVKNLDAANYIHQARIPGQRFKLDKDKVFYFSQKYFSHQFMEDTQFHNYDVAIIMSPLKTADLAGYTSMGNICNRNYSVAYVNIFQDYKRISTAIHEIAHLMSITHDGKGCKVEPVRTVNKVVASIMYPYAVPADEFVWSDCSKRKFAEAAKTNKLDCLKQKIRYN